MPDLFFYIDSKVTIDDHCYHEYLQLKRTSENVNDAHGRNIFEFLEKVLQESLNGWKVFDPIEQEIYNNLKLPDK